MESRIHIVTLAVRDLKRARQFYTQGLGWKESSASNENMVFIQTGCMALGLYGWKALAEDAGVPSLGTGFRGVTLAHNVPSEAAVEKVLQEAVAAGARLVKPGQKVFWGGYSGYFADPEEHLWEVAHNPFLSLTESGIALPK